MDAGLKEIVSILPDLDAISNAAAKEFASVVQEAVASRGICCVALSGGSTPQGLFRVLATRFQTKIPWNAVHIFWGDERFVPADSPDSNFRMAREALLDAVPIPRKNIHPISTEYASPEIAAKAFDLDLHLFFGNTLPSFDLILLGIGLDGHTASIFPTTQENPDEDVWAIPTVSPIEPVDRISLKLDVIGNARYVFVLISGDDKAEVVRQLFEQRKSAEQRTMPAARLTALEELHYFLDEAASP